MIAEAKKPDAVNPPSAEERERIVGRKIAGYPSGGYFVLYRGQYLELPVVGISADVLTYRADNGRLIMQLDELRGRKGLPPDHFRKNQDKPEVQRQLHGLLLDLSKDPEGPIYQELERQAMQTEPLLITALGVVVNGNRRLAAMRKLLAQNPDKYESFQSVRVAVLPAEATVQDIEYIEAALQLAPETKLPYNWINRRLKLRRQRDELKLPVAQIIDSYRLESARELERELQELELAETYLKDYCRRPGAYNLIEDAKDLFIGLNSALQTRSVNKPLWKQVGFAMIHSRQKLKLNLTGYFPFAPAMPPHAPRQALLELAADEGLIDREQTGEKDELPSGVQKDLIAILERSDESARIARSITDALDQIRIDYQEKNAPKRLLHNIQQARKIVERIEGKALSSMQKAEFASELAAIRHHSKRLLGESENPPSPISQRRRKLRKLKRDPRAYFADAISHKARNLRKLMRWFRSFFRNHTS